MPQVQLNTRIDISTHTDLHEYAKSSGKPIARIVEKALVNYLKEVSPVKINMAQVIKDAKTKYAHHNDPKTYHPGTALAIAVKDQVGEGDWEEITGNEWEDSDLDNFDSRIKLDAKHYYYTNNAYSVVLHHQNNGPRPNRAKGE